MARPDALMPRIGLLSNRKSGANLRGIDRIRATARAAGVDHVEIDHIEEVESALRGFARRDLEMLAVNGGDGTLDAVMTALRRSQPFPREPAIALLRGGTTNMAHRNLGIAGPSHRAFDRLIRQLESSAPAPSCRSQRMIALCADDGGEPTFGFFFAAAAIPRAILHVRARHNGTGPASALREALALSAQLAGIAMKRAKPSPIFHPDVVGLEIDGDCHDGRMVMVMATTLEKLILGLRPVVSAGRIGAAYLASPHRQLWRSLPLWLFGGGKECERGLWRASIGQMILRGQTVCMLDGEIIDRDPSVPLVLRLSDPARFVQL